MDERGDPLAMEMLSDRYFINHPELFFTNILGDDDNSLAQGKTADEHPHTGSNNTAKPDETPSHIGKNNENSTSSSTNKLSNKHKSSKIDQDEVRKKEEEESAVLEAAKQLSRQSPNGRISHGDLYRRLVDSGKFGPLSAANSIFRLLEAGKLIELKDYFEAYVLSDSGNKKT